MEGYAGYFMEYWCIFLRFFEEGYAGYFMKYWDARSASNFGLHIFYKRFIWSQLF
jgi:hypothetical protein